MSNVGPRVANPGKQPQSPPALKTPAVCTVLIADDEHLVATGIAGIVKDLGHSVVAIAPDGEAALAHAKTHNPTLALLDIRMPKLTGPEVAVRLKQEMNIPSIIISAYSDQQYLDQIRGNGASCGVYGYLLKPIDQDELRVAIGLALIRNCADGQSIDRIEQLERNISNRRTVEQAKWLLVQKKQFTEQQAHEKLQKAARDQRKPLSEIAEEVLKKGDLA